MLDKNKEISILFTRYTDFASRMVCFFSGMKFSHVSIALDTNDEYFYSFNTKGFKKEFPRKHKNRTGNSICYRLKISEESFYKLKELIEDFSNKQEDLSYNWIGVIFCIIGIPLFFSKKFFCSQFIAFILEAAGVMIFSKNYSKYLPGGIKKELDKKDFVYEKIVNPEFLNK